MNILIIQLRRIGDILLTTPAISYVRQAIKDASIDFLCEPCGRPVLETNPEIRDLLIYDKASAVKEITRVRARRYDAVIDFMNNPRSAAVAALSGARWKVGYKAGRGWYYNLAMPVPVEAEYVPKRKIRLLRHWLTAMGRPAPEPASVRPRLELTPEDSQFAKRWLAENQTDSKAFAVLAPAHRHPIRAWRRDGFRAAALHLARVRGLKPYLAWGPGEDDWMRDVRQGVESEIGLLPATSLRQMAAIFREARVVVTNDSGAMHLAVTTGTPTVTIYGPTRPIDWNPSLAGVDEGRVDIPLSAQGVDCLGCHLDSCPVGHICMTNLPDGAVNAAVDRAISGR